PAGSSGDRLFRLMKESTNLAGLMSGALLFGLAAVMMVAGMKYERRYHRLSPPAQPRIPAAAQLRTAITSETVQLERSLGAGTVTLAKELLALAPGDPLIAALRTAGPQAEAEARARFAAKASPDRPFDPDKDLPALGDISSLVSAVAGEDDARCAA